MSFCFLSICCPSTGLAPPLMPLKPLFHFLFVHAVAFWQSQGTVHLHSESTAHSCNYPCTPLFKSFVSLGILLLFFFFPTRSHVSIASLVCQISIHALLESCFIFHLCNEEADLVLALVNYMEIVETILELNECHTTQQEISVWIGWLWFSVSSIPSL